MKVQKTTIENCARSAEKKLEKVVFFIEMSLQMKYWARKSWFFFLWKCFSKMQSSQILHFSGDILKFYFIPEQFVPNVINLSGPASNFKVPSWEREKFKNHFSLASLEDGAMKTWQNFSMSNMRFLILPFGISRSY